MTAPELTVRPFMADDLRLFKIRPEQSSHMLVLDAAEAEALEDELTFSVICKGVIIGIFGVLIPWAGRGQAWSYISADIPRKAWPDLTDRVLESMYHIMETMKLHRMEITVAADHKGAQLWAERLGFTQEANMRKYGPQGQDFMLYALTDEVDHDRN
jgi:hypothetical protein